MQFESIQDIYSENDRARTDLKKVLSQVTDEEAGVLLDGEKWNVAEIVEHIASVNDGVFRICRKLLGKSQEADRPAAKQLNISDDFMNRSVEVHQAKLEAPERVHPTGTISIAESLERLDANRRQMEELKSVFETFDDDTAKFPHPFFGDISAVEWLIMAGGHEARHTDQIRKLLAKLR